MRLAITLLIPDRVGILREVTSAITDLGANIDGISQTVVDGYFTMTLTATFDNDPGMERIRESIQGRFGADRSIIGVLPYAPAPAAPVPSGERYIITISGPERSGILKAVTGFLADRRINIDDWYFKVSLPRVTHIGEITIPRSLDFTHLQNEFSEEMRRLGLQGRIQHENIFRATNEIGPIKSLLSESADAANR